MIWSHRKRVVQASASGECVMDVSYELEEIAGVLDSDDSDALPEPGEIADILASGDSDALPELDVVDLDLFPKDQVPGTAQRGTVLGTASPADSTHRFRLAELGSPCVLVDLLESDRFACPVRFEIPLILRSSLQAYCPG